MTEATKTFFVALKDNVGDNNGRVTLLTYSIAVRMLCGDTEIVFS